MELCWWPVEHALKLQAWAFIRNTIVRSVIWNFLLIFFFFIKPISSVHLKNASQRWEQNVLHYISVLHVAEHCCNMQGLYKLSTSLNNPKFLKRAHHLSWSRSETRGASSSSDPWKTCCQNPLREWRHHILRTRPHKVWTQPILQRHQIII